MRDELALYTEEIVSFFATKDLAVEVISKDFNSYSYKSQQCVVSINLKERQMERRALGIQPINVIVTLAQFDLIAMPGCCGIVISTNCWVLHRLQGLGIGQFLHKLRLKIAKEWGYGLLMCTDVDTNKRQKHILEKHGWKQLQQFNNPRTGNDVNIHTIVL